VVDPKVVSAAIIGITARLLQLRALLHLQPLPSFVLSLRLPLVLELRAAFHLLQARALSSPQE
jgi:hypothetical protein